MRSENRQNRRKTASDVENFHVIQEIDVTGSISSKRFTTGSRTNVFTAHAQILLPCLKHVHNIGQTPSLLERLFV